MNPYTLYDWVMSGLGIMLALTVAGLMLRAVVAAWMCCW